MASYLIFTPPGGPRADHRSTRFIPDEFSWLAFLFPVIWLLFHRLWIPAVIIILVQMIAGQMIANSTGWIAGYALAFASNLLAGLEGRELVAKRLTRLGWHLDEIVSADDLETAEEIFFSTFESTASATVTHPALPSSPSVPVSTLRTGGRGPALGLLDFDRGR